MGADILVVPEEYAGSGQTVILAGTPTSFFFEDSGFEKISGIKGVAKTAPQIYIATLFASCCAAPVQMIAIDPARDFTVSSWLKENPGVTLGKDDIIIGSAIIQDVGKDLIFYGHTFHVAGVLSRTGMGVDNAVFTRVDDAYVMADESGEKAVKKLTIPQGKVSAVLVQVDPGTSPAKVASEITARVPGTKTILPEGLISAVSSQLGATTRLLYLSALAVTVMSIPLLGLVSVLVANERRREVSILRVLGATKKFVAGLMLAESATLAIAGGLIGIGSAAGGLILFQDFITFTLNIPFVIPSPLALLVHGGSALLLVILVAGVATVYPAVLIVRSEPYRAIREGDL